MLCSLTMPLDARFSQIRTCETNVANWVRLGHSSFVAPTIVLTHSKCCAYVSGRRAQVADTMMTWLNTDVVILNSGSLRSDGLIPAGPFTMRDLVKLLPMQDEVGRSDACDLAMATVV